VYVDTKRCGTIAYSPGRAIYYIACNGLTGREVKIVQNNNYLHMAEVQVWGGTGAIKGVGLLSYHKPSTMLTTGHGGVASRAVDGNANGWWKTGTGIHTAGKKHAWQVDLEKVYPVYTVIVHNRWDNCCTSRINGAKVYVDTHLCGTIKYKKGVSVYPVNCGGKKGRIVKITHKTIINIAEVEVLGTGGPSMFGPTMGSGNVKLLSLRRPATMTSAYRGGDAYKAVDGQTNGYWGTGYVLPPLTFILDTKVLFVCGQLLIHRSPLIFSV